MAITNKLVVCAILLLCLAMLISCSDEDNNKKQKEHNQQKHDKEVKEHEKQVKEQQKQAKKQEEKKAKQREEEAKKQEKDHDKPKPKPKAPAKPKPQPAAPAKTQPQPAAPVKPQPQPASPAKPQPQPAAPANPTPQTALPASVGPKPTPRGPEKIFNVLDFGVKAGPSTDNAINFIKAFKAACNNPGNARLVVPKGEFYASAMVFQGPCKSPLVFEIQGIMKTLSDISMYTEDFWISFEKIDTGLEVSGTGTIDGQGPNVWQYKEKGGPMFPISLKFIQITHGLMRDLTSINPMGFHISIVECNDVTATNMHLVAPEDSPNTDGFHISQSTKVRVFDSVVGTGDDCVGIIHGSIDVLVKNVRCGPGHGLSVGSLGKYDDEKLLKDIVITNCTLTGTDNGARIKTYAGSLPSIAQNITFSDIVMSNVENPIIIDQHYGKKSGEPSKVQITDVKFIEIRGTTTTEVGVDIQCSKVVPCQAIRLSNINLNYVGEKQKPFSSNCTNAKLIYDGPQVPGPCR